jgi:hypothetical protein
LVEASLREAAASVGQKASHLVEVLLEVLVHELRLDQGVAQPALIPTLLQHPILMVKFFGDSRMHHSRRHLRAEGLGFRV